MGTLFSGTGLISGLDISGLVDRLIAVESRPRDQIKERISRLDAQKTAFLDISARISQMLSRAATLKLRTAFTATNTTSSNADVLSVIRGENVAPGSYSFLVKQLATTHQVVSRGFASKTSPIGVGTLTLESGAARISRDVRLDELNGYAGVQRGKFVLRDAAGKEATIDTTDALTVREVVERINAAGLNLQASVRGDGLTLRELSGGAITVRESGSSTAADLGLLGTGATQTGGTLTGRGLVQLSNRTPLSAINDGNGVDRAKSGNDFTIADLAGDITVDLSGILKPETALARLNHGDGVQLGKIRLRAYNENGSPIEREVDLSSAKTVNDVKTALEGALTGVSVTISSNQLVVSYDDKNDDTANKLEIEEVGGRTAGDLGLVATTDNGRIRGGVIMSMDTVGDVLAAINHAPGNESIEATLSGSGIQISSRIGSALTLTAGDSNALADLGLSPDAAPAPTLTGERLLSSIGSVRFDSLNGGRGYQLGVVSIAAGATNVQVDLSAADSLQGALDAINDAAAANGGTFTAEYDPTGTRIVLRSLDGATPLTVADVSGDFATATGLAGSGVSRRSANLQKQYVSEGTSLAGLRGGTGIGLGTIQITNSKGLSAEVNLGSARTVGDVLRAINDTKLGDGSLGVTARINDTGDGILLEDAAGGTQALKVVDESGTAARDLKLAGESATGRIDGTYELRITAGATTTLNDVMSQINSDGSLATAAVLNDGSPVSPFRMQVTSRRTGAAGELVLDEEGLDLDLATLSAAQDAKVLLGGAGGAGLLVTSSSNTLAGTVPGLTVELTGVSDQLVHVTASKSNDKLLEDMSGLIQNINEALDRIDDYTGYDVETERAGILLGDSSLRSAEQRLLRLFSGFVPNASGGITRFGDLGVSVRNGRLEFDQAKFTEQLESNPDGLVDFFTDVDQGFGKHLNDQLEALNNPTGLLKSREKSLEKQRTLLDTRVDQLDALLERKRARLMRQYQAMESVLAQLQAQQSALGQLSSVAAQFGAG